MYINVFTTWWYSEDLWGEHIRRFSKWDMDSLEGELHGTCHRVTFHGLFDTCHCVDCQITRGAEMITQQGIHLPTKVRRWFAGMEYPALKTNGFYLGKRKIIFNNLQWCLGRGDVSCQEVINPLLPDGFIVFSLLFGFVLLEFAVKSLSSVICLKNTSESSTHLKALVEIGNLSYGWK